jgi:hypothetical protein
MGGQIKKGMFGDSDTARTSRHEAKRLRAYQKELLIRNGNIYHKHTPVKDFGPSRSTGASTEDHYSILKELLYSDGVTVAKLRFAAHLVESGNALDAYSNSEIATIVGKCERTARSIRTWAGGLQLTQSTPVKKVAACSVVLTEQINKLEKKELVDLHAAKKSLGPAWTLALRKLNAVRFNRYQGEISVPQRARRIAAWVDRWGVENVLHALWLAEGPSGARKNNLAGYVRTLVESGKKAPKGWVHPELHIARPLANNDQTALHIQFADKPPASLLETLVASPFEYDPDGRFWSATSSAWARDVFDKIASSAGSGVICSGGELNEVPQEEEAKVASSAIIADPGPCGGELNEVSQEEEAKVASSGQPTSATEVPAGLLVLRGCRGVAPPFVYCREQNVWLAPDGEEARRVYEVAQSKFRAVGIRVDSDSDYRLPTQQGGTSYER